MESMPPSNISGDKINASSPQRPMKKLCFYSQLMCYVPLGWPYLSWILQGGRHYNDKYGLSIFRRTIIKQERDDHDKRRKAR